MLDLYGTQGVDGSFGANCLLARRLAERGVRFIQLYHRDWDHHGAVKEHSQGTAAEVDQGAAALVKDLKQRGMLDETLVVWGGEFGRTPMAQGDGRDHHIKGFSIWMAGGGIKGGHHPRGDRRIRLRRRASDVVHVHDLHATILALFGIDHLRLVYRFQGRDFRLTDVAGQVVRADSGVREKSRACSGRGAGTGSAWKCVRTRCCVARRSEESAAAWRLRMIRSGPLAAGSIGGSCPRLELTYAAVSIPSKAARRPARLE